METDHKRNRKREQPEENTVYKELPIEIRKLLTKPCLIAAIVSAENNVDFLMTYNRTKTIRQVFTSLLPHLRKDVFLQIQDFKVINIHCMAEESHEKDQWWIKLINGECYNISPDYRATFLDNLYYMTRFKEIRERNERMRHKRLFSSKFDI